VFHENITTCEVCDLVNEIPPLHDGERLKCRRCSHILVSIYPHASLRILGIGCSALLMLFLSVCFPFLSFSSNGAVYNMTLLDTIIVLLGHEYHLLGSLLCLVLLVFPLTYLLSVLYLAWSFLNKQRRLFLQRLFARWFVVIEPWLMVDVFLIGVLIALVKMHSLVDIELGLSFWAFCGYVLLLLKTVTLVDRRWLWHQVAGLAPHHAAYIKSAKDQGLVGCHFCGATLKESAHHCVRCGHAVYSRRPASLAATIALLIAASIMYVPAMFFPIMETTFLGSSEPSTIMEGVLLLWSLGSYPIAFIILIASVVIPLAKIFALSWLCWQCYFPAKKSIQQKIMLYKLTELVGRWSMIDIFVVAVLVSLVQMGNLMSILPGSAVLSFTAVIVLTMWAAMIFDPRLLWDNDEAFNMWSAKETKE